ncbi:MAG: ADP-ribosylation factor-like protein [Myxococcota bacterium]
MSVVNAFKREVAIKVVYYGPGLGGKTSSLQFIHHCLKPESRGQLVSLATGADRTLYFDFLPIKLPKFGGFSVRMQLYTVPGQVHYNSTRKLVLTGSDGVVFVADSQASRFEANLESLENLEENIREQGLLLSEVPLIFQWNKRDMNNTTSVGELESALNHYQAPSFETVATKGVGVMEAMTAITTDVLRDLRRKNLLKRQESSQSVPAVTTETELPEVEVSSPPEPSSLPEPDSTPVVQSFADLVDVVDTLAKRPEAPEAAPPPTRSLSHLVDAPDARLAVIDVETMVDAHDWQGAVRRSGSAFRALSSRLATAFPGTRAAEAAALAALRTGISAERLTRFREVESRALSNGAVSSLDALFSLLFIADFAVRLEELERR